MPVVRQARWRGTVIAEATEDELLTIEGNWYFPPASLKREYFRESGTHTTCWWKGEASYYNVEVDGETNTDAAWYYPVLKAGAAERIHSDFTGYVAFWRGVTVS